MVETFTMAICNSRQCVLLVKINQVATRNVYINYILQKITIQSRGFSYCSASLYVSSCSANLQFIIFRYYDTDLTKKLFNIQINIARECI